MYISFNSSNFKTYKQTPKKSLSWSMFCEHSIHQGREIKVFACLRRWCSACRRGWRLRFNGWVWGHTISRGINLTRSVETALVTNKKQPKLAQIDNRGSSWKLNERGTVYFFFVFIYRWYNQKAILLTYLDTGYWGVLACGCAGLMFMFAFMFIF